MIRTVIGNIKEDIGLTLVHEHICCYSEYLYQIVEKVIIKNPIKMFCCGE